MKKSLQSAFPIIALLIKWSGVAVTDGRGKAGGSVFSKGRSGAYVRNKVTPVDRKSPAQQAAKSLLAFFAQGWRALTEAQINAWNTAANNGFTTTNIFGDTIKRSGINLYVGLNLNLRLIGQAAISNPPIASSVSNSFPITPAVAVGATTLFVEGENVSGGTTVPAGTSWVVMSTGPVSQGKSFVSSEFRVFAVQAAATDTATDNLWTDYVDKFGTPVAGQKIYFQTTAVNNTTGQAGIPQKQYAIVAA